MEIFEIRAKCDCGSNEIKIESTQAIQFPLICGYCKRKIDFRVEQPKAEETKSEYHIDIENRIALSERNRLRRIIKMIQEKFYDRKQIKIEELKTECEKIGLTETEMNEAIEQLLKNGEYYKSNPDTLAKV